MGDCIKIAFIHRIRISMEHFGAKHYFFALGKSNKTKIDENNWDDYDETHLQDRLGRVPFSPPFQILVLEQQRWEVNDGSEGGNKKY